MKNYYWVMFDTMCAENRHDRGLRHAAKTYAVPSNPSPLHGLTGRRLDMEHAPR